MCKLDKTSAGHGSKRHWMRNECFKVLGMWATAEGHRGDERQILHVFSQEESRFKPLYAYICVCGHGYIHGMKAEKHYWGRKGVNRRVGVRKDNEW